MPFSQDEVRLRFTCDTKPVEQGLTRLSREAASFSAAISGAFRTAVSGGRAFEDVLKELTLRIATIAFDAAKLELRRGDELIHLTTGEASLLKLLAVEPGRSISRAELGARSRISGSDRAVDVQIVRLRRKIEDDPRQPRYLLTMRGEGYALRAGS